MSRYFRAGLGITLYVGMLATLLYIFIVLSLNILTSGPSWLFIPMIAAGASALRVGDWWLPILTKHTK